MTTSQNAFCIEKCDALPMNLFPHIHAATAVDPFSETVAPSQQGILPENLYQLGHELRVRGASEAHIQHFIQSAEAYPDMVCNENFWGMMGIGDPPKIAGFFQKMLTADNTRQ